MLMKILDHEYVLAEAPLEPRQTSLMESFCKIINGFLLLTISYRASIRDVWQSSKYTFDLLQKAFLGHLILR